jgi:carboxylesterase type B
LPADNPIIAWEEITELWLNQSLAVTPALQALDVEISRGLNTSEVPLPSPLTSGSEDCLFLDVVVPMAVYDAAYARHKWAGIGKPRDVSSKGVPVVVWLYGGGFVAGDKISGSDPAGLLARSQEDGNGPFIFVSINYRLGLFGWLAGSDEIDTNVGLLDQRLALRWVQENIQLFGGDPNRVTLMGESAGASSILYHITAYGGADGKPDFQQASLSSIATNQPLFQAQQEENLQLVFKTASALTNSSITTISQLRSLSLPVLYYTNALIVENSLYGLFTYGPVIDGSLIPDLPSKLLSQGRFHHNIPLLISRNSDEGLLFTSPFITNQTSYTAYIQQLLPTASPSAIDFITNTLYPPTFNTSLYTAQYARTALTIADFEFNCNDVFLASAQPELTHVLLFAVQPGLHGDSQPYIFFNGDTTSLDAGYPVNATLAGMFQDLLAGFIVKGDPGFGVYGGEEGVLVMSAEEWGVVDGDGEANERCAFWGAGTYAP